MLLAEKPQIDPVVALLRAKHNFPEMIASISFEAIASPARAGQFGHPYSQRNYR